MNISFEELSEIQIIKLVRNYGSELGSIVKKLPMSHETQQAIDKFTEGVMWLGKELQRRNEEYPYPNSSDPSTGDIIDPTAQEISTSLNRRGNI